VYGIGPLLGEDDEACVGDVVVDDALVGHLEKRNWRATDIFWAIMNIKKLKNILPKI
jgi:hypothetical protein